MEPTRIVFVLLSAVVASTALAGEVDPRFDGRWVGSETYQYGRGGPGGVVTRILPVQTILGIADHGKTLGITKGWAKGRYEIVASKSSGDTLQFQMPNTQGDKFLYIGRQHCTLSLSTDGNTIKESGLVILSIDRGGHGLGAVMWGTFRRQGSY